MPAESPKVNVALSIAMFVKVVAVFPPERFPTVWFWPLRLSVALPEVKKTRFVTGFSVLAAAGVQQQRAAADERGAGVATWLSRVSVLVPSLFSPNVRTDWSGPGCGRQAGC